MAREYVVSDMTPAPGEVWRVEYAGVAAEVRIDRWDERAQQWFGRDELDGRSWGLTADELQFRVAAAPKRLSQGERESLRRAARVARMFGTVLNDRSLASLHANPAHSALRRARLFSDCASDAFTVACVEAGAWRAYQDAYRAALRSVR